MFQYKQFYVCALVGVLIKCHSPTVDKFINDFTPIQRVRKRYLSVSV